MSMESDESTSLRPATPADYAAYVRLFPELRVDAAMMAPRTFEQEWMPTTIVAIRGSATVGIAYYQVLKALDGATAYLRVIITAPEARRTGVGRLLMNAVVERCRASGCVDWCLNVFPHNAAAVALYESYGMKRVHVSKAVKMP